MVGKICGLFRGFFLYGGLLIAARSDLKSKKIPNCVLLFLLWTGLLLTAAESCANREYVIFISAAAGFLAGGGPVLLCRLLFRGIGAGDVKLLAVAGLYLGVGEILEVFACSMLLAGAFCLGLLLSGKGGRKREIALAPFILLAAILMCWHVYL